MIKFAVLNDDKVVNVIVADSKEFAEQVTGKICIEYTDEPAEPEGTWDGVRFFPKKPADNFIWNEEKNCWVDPDEEESDGAAAQ